VHYGAVTTLSRAVVCGYSQEHDVLLYVPLRKEKLLECRKKCFTEYLKAEYPIDKREKCCVHLLSYRTQEFIIAASPPRSTQFPLSQPDIF
jgi:hypothetical protein